MSATTEAVTSASRKLRRADTTPRRIRFLSRVHRHRLDRELAAGADPNDDPLRGERARALVGERERGVLAASLERLIADAETPPRPFSSRAPLARTAIRDSRGDLEQLVERLRASAYISPRGVAMLVRLLTDGAGPLYGSGTTPAQLRWSLAATVDAIDHGPVIVA
jgi:hypothetical protein